MRVIIQRVTHASVTIDGECLHKIGRGYMLLVGICDGDTKEISEKLARKTVDLRIWEDDAGKMNRGLKDVGGEILSISQFTLYADCKNGRRPSFIGAAKPEISKPLYEYFNECLKAQGVTTYPGVFGADMKIDLLNDGPVTIILDSDEL